MPQNRNRRRALIAAFGLAAALSGCGRRGPLDPAPGSGLATSRPLATPDTPDDAQNPGAPTPHPRNVIPSKEPFVLDPLL